NGTAIHGFELDDAHVSSSLHPGAVTVPASLAVAEAVGAAGADVLVALAAGYEVGLRVGICAGVSHSTSGYHVTGTVGTFGAAAAAARLLRLSPEQSAHALGIGGTQAAGLYSARTGAMTKRFHAGRASQSGVIAANLAQLTIRMSKKGQLNVCWPYEPGEVISAQMNGYYIAAVTLLDGDAFIEQFAKDRLADRNILDLVPRIEITHDPKLDAGGAA